MVYFAFPIVGEYMRSMFTFDSVKEEPLSFCQVAEV